MIRLWSSSALIAFLAPLLIDWGRKQAEEQIDKMQEAAFNTPGAEAPLPGSVIGAAAALLVGHFVVGRLVFRLRVWQSLLSLVFGLTAGLLFVLLRVNGDDQSAGTPS